MRVARLAPLGEISSVARSPFCEYWKSTGSSANRAEKPAGSLSSAQRRNSRRRPPRALEASAVGALREPFEARQPGVGAFDQLALGGRDPLAHGQRLEVFGAAEVDHQRRPRRAVGEELEQHPLGHRRFEAAGEKRGEDERQDDRRHRRTLEAWWPRILTMSTRLDKWLTIARVYKTRTLSAHACDLSRVRVNGVAVKPHRNLVVGDRIEAEVDERLDARPHRPGDRRQAAAQGRGRPALRGSLSAPSDRRSAPTADAPAAGGARKGRRPADQERAPPDGRLGELGLRLAAGGGAHASLRRMSEIDFFYSRPS